MKILLHDFFWINIEKARPQLTYDNQFLTQEDKEFFDNIFFKYNNLTFKERKKTILKEFVRCKDRILKIIPNLIKNTSEESLIAGLINIKVTLETGTIPD